MAEMDSIVNSEQITLRMCVYYDTRCISRSCSKRNWRCVVKITSVTCHNLRFLNDFQFGFEEVRFSFVVSYLQVLMFLIFSYSYWHVHDTGHVLLLSLASSNDLDGRPGRFCEIWTTGISKVPSSHELLYFLKLSFLITLVTNYLFGWLWSTCLVLALISDLKWAKLRFKLIIWSSLQPSHDKSWSFKYSRALIIRTSKN